MQLRMLGVNRFLFIIAILFVLFIGLLRGQDIISPSEDVFIHTFGGGLGANLFLKYDISSVPGGDVIDSVFLTPFVWQIATNWDGDANFWNVNDQTWTGSDSSRLIWGLPTSDSTHQASGFATAIGWTKSVDLKDIFLTDYNAGHTYCSIKIKDPDDRTFMPQPGTYPINSNDTLILGSILDSGFVFMYPSEYPNAPPWLVVHHHLVGIAETQISADELSVQVCPNPFRKETQIRYMIHDTRDRIQDFSLEIYDVSGHLVKEFNLQSEICNLQSVKWQGTDNADRPVPVGVYFCKMTVEERTVVKKICLVR